MFDDDSEVAGQNDGWKRKVVLNDDSDVAEERSGGRQCARR